MDHCVYIKLNDDFNKIKLKLNLVISTLFLQKILYFLDKIAKMTYKIRLKIKNPISFMQFL